MEGGAKIKESVTEGLKKDYDEWNQKIRLGETVEDSDRHSKIPNQSEREADIKCQYHKSAVNDVYFSPSIQISKKNAKNYAYYQDQENFTDVAHSSISLSTGNDYQYQDLSSDLKTLHLQSVISKPKAYLIEAHYASKEKPNPRKWKAIAKVLDPQCNCSRENNGTISIIRTRNNKDETAVQFQADPYLKEEVEVPHVPRIDERSEIPTSEIMSQENSVNGQNKKSSQHTLKSMYHEYPSLAEMRKMTGKMSSVSGRGSMSSQHTLKSMYQDYPSLAEMRKMTGKMSSVSERGSMADPQPKQEVEVQHVPRIDERSEIPTSEVRHEKNSVSGKNKKSSHHSLKDKCHDDKSVSNTKIMTGKNISANGRGSMSNQKSLKGTWNEDPSVEKAKQILENNISSRRRGHKSNKHSLKKTCKEDPSVEETRKILEKKISASGRGSKSRERKDKNVQFSKTAERLAGHRRRHYSLPVMNDNITEEEDADKYNQNRELTRKGTKLAMDKVEHRKRRDSLPPMHIDDGAYQEAYEEDQVSTRTLPDWLKTLDGEYVE